MKLYQERHGDYLLSICQDEDPMSPREWDNLTTLVCFHGRYDLGDKHNYSSEDYSGWGELRDGILGRENVVVDADGPVIVPLYLLDHSGITMRAGRGFGDVDPGGWDSGQVGWAFVTDEKMRETGAPLNGEHGVRVQLHAEIEQYDAYLCGDVYGYVVQKVETCDKGHEHSEMVGSCWGFYCEEDKGDGLRGFGWLLTEARAEIPEEARVENVVGEWL